jgi:hypothetical protein
VVAGDGAEVAVAVEVHLHRPPEVVRDVVEHAPGGVGVSLIGAVEP